MIVATLKHTLLKVRCACGKILCEWDRKSLTLIVKTGRAMYYAKPPLEVVCKCGRIKTMEDFTFVETEGDI